MSIIKLENWAVVQFEESYSAPELCSLHFKGFAYGHPKYEDGYPIVTTRIVSYKDGIFTTYSGSQYELGTVDPDYEKVYPNALDRVFESAKNL